MKSFTKTAYGSPEHYFKWEAAGLRWLAQAEAVAVVEVIEVGSDHLKLQYLSPTRPRADHARLFGRNLAMLHHSGAGGFGVAPPGWTGDGWLGPADEPLAMPCDSYPTWGRYYATSCLRPMADLAERRGNLSAEDRWAIEGVCARLIAGDFDDDQAPARLHGDLWSGNLIWTDQQVVLIDPAAHGGHPETDLAMLQLFGAPHLDLIIAGYQEVAPLVPGWQRRLKLHQLHPLLLHSALFGGSYGVQAGLAAAKYL